MTIAPTQMAAIALAAYFLCFPVLGWLMPSPRANAWQSVFGWLILRAPTRLLISAVTVIVAILWTWQMSP